MALLAPRIGNDVSYVTQISADIHFVWQAQHFVTFWEIAKCCILQYKIVSKMGRVRSPKRRVRDDDFVFGLSSDILESSFYWRKHSGSFCSNLELQDFVAGAVFGEVGG